MNQKLFNIIISILVFILGISLIVYTKTEHKPPEIKVEIIVNGEPGFLSKSPQHGLMEALQYYNVKHPKIVYAQAVLETGNFNSRLCKENNNLFGLYDSKNKKYYSYNHWSESVVSYCDYIQSKYKPPNNYYKFLKEIGYAEDPQYINKVKAIANSQ